ncbi:hypothetical protein T484DRAFT_1644202, partial [Baffinella frigidus]
PQTLHPTPHTPHPTPHTPHPTPHTPHLELHTPPSQPQSCERYKTRVPRKSLS